MNLLRTIHHYAFSPVRALRRMKALKSQSKQTPGSSEWLIATEMKYGGIIKGVKRHKVSPMDPRPTEELRKGGMHGGDRMYHHGYAELYAQYLRPHLSSSEKITLAEVGILKGTGLAIWSELFPGARIIGLDIDLQNIENHLPALRSRGAFKQGDPELYEFDQFKNNSNYLAKLLQGERISVGIDDGVHSNESILMTLKSLMPHFAETFTMFIEDNDHVHTVIQETYPELHVVHKNSLTILVR